MRHFTFFNNKFLNVHFTHSISRFGLATFQMLSSHLWLWTTILDSTDLE